MGSCVAIDVAVADGHIGVGDIDTTPRGVGGTVGNAQCLQGWGYPGTGIAFKIHDPRLPHGIQCGWIGLRIPGGKVGTVPTPYGQRLGHIGHLLESVSGLNSPAVAGHLDYISYRVTGIDGGLDSSV